MTGQFQLARASNSGDALDKSVIAIEQALTEAFDLDSVKRIRDQAEAVRVYARTARTGLELQNRFARIKVRAERRAGELLQEMADRGERSGGAHGGNRRSSCMTQLETLGIRKHQSARWQRLAGISEAAFESEVQRILDSKKELTTAALLRFADQLDRRRRNAALAAVESPTRSAERLTGIGVYRTIYADPPWGFANGGTRAAAISHYPCMTTAQIAALNVAQVADDPCHLHLWVPFSLLPDGLRVMEAWGFEYRTGFCWNKGKVVGDSAVPAIGLGNYWRTASELLLFGTRGETTPFLDKSVPNWILAEAGRHSSKPRAVRELVERASPPPRIELFARGKPAEGWTAWGNETDAS